jgi:hypothetical protein
MATIESLPADQRAVLQLVLQRGRTYDEIARLLSIDRAGVRARALAAFDALGPQTRVPPERRALIADYLLGQLPPRVRATTRDRLAESAIERAWARVLSAELAPLASGPLPDIPNEMSRHEPQIMVPLADPEPEPRSKPKRESVLLKRSRRNRAPQEPKPERAPREPKPERAAREPKPKRESVLRGRSRRDREPKPERAAPEPKPERAAREPKPKRESVLLGRVGRNRPPREPKPERERQSRSRGQARSDERRISRFGGAVLLIGLVVVVAVAAFAILHKSGKPAPASPAAAASSTTTSTAAAAPPASGSSTTSTSASVIAQVNLTPPSGGSKAAGIAEVLRQGATKGIAIVAQHVTPNTTKPPDAYAVWLYNSPTDAHILGFVNPGVAANGRLSTAGALPANASHFKQLVVTRETSGSPKAPGTIILQGKLTGV